MEGPYTVEYVGGPMDGQVHVVEFIAPNGARAADWQGTHIYLFENRMTANAAFVYAYDSFEKHPWVTDA